MSNIQFSIFPPMENFIDLSLYQFGKEKTDPSHLYGPAARNHYLFHYILSGSGTLFAEDEDKVTREYHIKSGQGFMIFPGQITTYIADKDVPWEYTWVEFDGLRVYEALKVAGITKNNPIYRTRLTTIQENMKNEMLYMAEHGDETPFHLIGHLYLFFDALLRSIVPEQKKNTKKIQDYYIRQVLAYIEQHYQENLSVEQLANLCGLNRSYFGKIFKQSIGKSPQQFLLSYRMIKAAELLKLSKLSIAEIGISVGYENQLHFSRAFKNIYGKSPRVFRNENIK